MGVDNSVMAAMLLAGFAAGLAVAALLANWIKASEAKAATEAKSEPDPEPAAQPIPPNVATASRQTQPKLVRKSPGGCANGKCGVRRGTEPWLQSWLDAAPELRDLADRRLVRQLNRMADARPVLMFAEIVSRRENDRAGIRKRATSVLQCLRTLQLGAARRLWSPTTSALGRADAWRLCPTSAGREFLLLSIMSDPLLPAAEKSHILLMVTAAEKPQDDTVVRAALQRFATTHPESTDEAQAILRQWQAAMNHAIADAQSQRNKETKHDD